MVHETRGRTLKTTETTLQVIETIAEFDGARMSEIADHLGLANSTVHSHLSTLRKHRYVTKQGDVYQLGLRFFHIGQQARHRDPRYAIAKEKAVNLASTTNEEANFSVEDHGRVVTLFDEIYNPVVEGFQVGHIFHMHNTSSGKSILAELPRRRVVEILDGWGLPTTTENTITDRDELFDELERTRERGYAINNQETMEGLRSIGMAVTNPDGSVFGALDVSGPPYRLQNDEKTATELSKAVEELEAELASGPSP